MFGSIGLALGAVITGLLIEYYSDRTTDSVGKNYLPLYLFSLAMLSLDTLWSFKLKVPNLICHILLI